MTDSPFPRFAPDAALIVDAHNGDEEWTGQRWNEYAASCEEHQEAFIVRLVRIVDRGTTTGELGGAR